MFHNCEGQSLKTVSTDLNLLKRKESQSGFEPYQPKALSLGLGSPQQSVLVRLYRLTPAVSAGQSLPAHPSSLYRLTPAVSEVSTPAVFTGSPQQSLRSVFTGSPQQSVLVSLYRLTPAASASQSLPTGDFAAVRTLATDLCHVHYHPSSCRDLLSVDHNTPLTPIAPDVRVRQLSASQWSVLDWPHMLCTLSVISSHTCQNHT